MIIFLDIDGVLNQLQGNYYIDDKCVEQLSILVKKLNARIVLTSTWRLGFAHSINYCSPQIVKLRQRLQSKGVDIYSRTGVANNRADEVRQYLLRDSDKFLVLDDDKSLFDGKLQNLYTVNAKTGLTSKDVKKILRKHQG